jgi:hypothetical protein
LLAFLGQGSSTNALALQDSQTTAGEPHGHRYIAAIGIDGYQNWHHLRNAESDAKGFATLLHDNYGFEYADAEHAPALTGKDADHRAIDELIDGIDGKVTAADDLIVFFAGHGYSRPVTIGAKSKWVGYLIPVEARAVANKDTHWADYIELKALLQKITAFKARHIVVVLDSCFSGIAIDDAITDYRSDPSYRDDLKDRIGRLVITSAGSDQVAADSGPLPKHSLFTGILIDQLSRSGETFANRGFIPASELGAQVKSVVERTGSNQSPKFAKFDGDLGGDLVLPLRGADLTTNSPAAYTRSLIPPEHGSSAEMEADLCTSGDLNTCRELGYRYESGNGVDRDATKAVAYYKRSCEGGNALGCRFLGVMYEHGYDVDVVDYAKAESLYNKACVKGNSTACRFQGSLYEGGKVGPQDFPKALGLYTKACVGGDELGCSFEGLLYEKGRGTQPDPKRAFSLYDEACKSNEPTGCHRLGTLYELGTSTPPNAEQAVNLYQKSCDLGNSVGCTKLGVMYEAGRGVLQSFRRAYELDDGACKKGNWDACVNLGWLIENGKLSDPDPLAALTFYDKACSNDEFAGCRNAGVLYHRGKGVPVDFDRAFYLYTLACNAGEMRGCNGLGVLYQDGQVGPPDLDKARRLYSKACDGDDGNGCDNLGIVYQSGIGVTPDPQKAFDLFSKGCKLTYASSCRLHGLMLESGALGEKRLQPR